PLTHTLSLHDALPISEGRAQGAFARLRQHALLARSAERAADDRVHPRRAFQAEPRRPPSLRSQPQRLSLKAGYQDEGLDREACPAPRHQGGGDARQLDLLRRALRAGDRRRRRADARRAALACGAGEALRAHARGRRQAGDRRHVFESVAGAPDRREDGRAQRHAAALGRRLSGPVRREREAPDAMIELLAWPFVAGLALTAMHAWFGLHVLARGVIFVDLALAQVAALGITVAILYGHPVHSEAAYWYALAFAGGGAVLFALARPYEASMRQEAVIGIVYAVSAALGVLALDRAPQGAEHIKQLLIGSILTVTPQEVGALAALYGLIGAAHWALRRPLIEVSFDPLLAGARRRHVFLWDGVLWLVCAGRHLLGAHRRGAAGVLLSHR